MCVQYYKLKCFGKEQNDLLRIALISSELAGVGVKKNE